MPRKKSDDILSRLATIHEREEQNRETDGETPTDSQYRAYAQHRTVKSTSHKILKSVLALKNRDRDLY